MKTVLIILILFTVSIVVSVAKAASSPEKIVRNLYQPYLAHDQKPMDALEAIYPHASGSLKQAVDKENACIQREKEICNIDFDIIIDGQDWTLSNLILLKNQPDKNHIIISAKFLNMGSRKIVRYFFIQENGQWKIDDIEAINLNREGKIDFQYLLKKSLLH